MTVWVRVYVCVPHNVAGIYNNGWESIFRKINENTANKVQLTKETSISNGPLHIHAVFYAGTSVHFRTQSISMLIFTNCEHKTQCKHHICKINNTQRVFTASFRLGILWLTSRWETHSIYVSFSFCFCSEPLSHITQYANKPTNLLTALSTCS